MYYSTIMESNKAIEALLALGQESRLAAYRLLVEHEPYGLPSGEIARRLGVNASTMSRHLAQLERAGLLRSWRDQRQVMYAVDYDGTERLMRFLQEDCCKAHRRAAKRAAKQAHKRGKSQRRKKVPAT